MCKKVVFFNFVTTLRRCALLKDLNKHLIHVMNVHVWHISLSFNIL